MSDTPKKYPDNEKLTNPFNGAASFEADQAAKFFGRENERNKLLQLIEVNTLTLLYSKSGMGKSSLLKAGLLPALKNSKRYFPVYINVRESKQKNFQELVVNRLFEEVENLKISLSPRFVDISDLLKDSEANGSHITETLFLNKFHFSESSAEKEAIPLLIFDQFEEIFSTELASSSVTSLIDDLSYVIEGNIPAYLENILSGINGKYGNILSELIEELTTTKWYRILFSFREEYINNFSRLKQHIPSVFYGNNHLFLEPFDLEIGTSVLEKTMNLFREYLPTGIEYDIANLISDENQITQRKEIYPFIFSLTGQQLFPKIVRHDKEVIEKIQSREQSLVQDIVNNYCDEVFSQVSSSTRKYVEDMLITADGKRTILAVKSIPDKRLKELKKLDKDEPNQQKALRYLNFIDIHGGQHVEILHDQLALPLKKSRAKRQKKEQRVRRIVFPFAVIAISSVFLLFKIQQNNEETRKNKAYVAVLNNVTETKLENLRNSNGSLTALADIINFDSVVQAAFGNNISSNIDTMRDSVIQILTMRAIYYRIRPATISPNGQYRAYIKDSVVCIDKLHDENNFSFEPYDKFDINFPRYGYISMTNYGLVYKSTSEMISYSYKSRNVIDQSRYASIHPFVKLIDTAFTVISGSHAKNTYTLMSINQKNPLLTTENAIVRTKENYKLVEYDGCSTFEIGAQDHSYLLYNSLNNSDSFMNLRDDKKSKMTILECGWELKLDTGGFLLYHNGKMVFALKAYGPIPIYVISEGICVIGERRSTIVVERQDSSVKINTIPCPFGGLAFRKKDYVILASDRGTANIFLYIPNTWQKFDEMKRIIKPILTNLPKLSEQKNWYSVVDE